MEWRRSKDNGVEREKEGEGKGQWEEGRKG